MIDVKTIATVIVVIIVVLFIMWAIKFVARKFKQSQRRQFSKVLGGIRRKPLRNHKHIGGYSPPFNDNDQNHDYDDDSYEDNDYFEEYSEYDIRKELRMAIFKNNIEKIIKLIENGVVDVNNPIDPIDDDHGWLPLHYAAYFDRADIIKLLFEQGAVINAKNFDGQTPYDLANELKHFKVAQLLFDYMK